MNFPYTIFEITVTAIIVYLVSVLILFYRIKVLYPDFFNDAYPYGFMMTKGGVPVSLSKNLFQRGITTLMGHWKMAKILLTSRFSENKTILSLKVISRILLIVGVCC